jgi:hypothetical protein
MGRCVQRTDQDESFANESAELCELQQRPSALTNNLVECSYQLNSVRKAYRNICGDQIPRTPMAAQKRLKRQGCGPFRSSNQEAIPLMN